MKTDCCRNRARVTLIAIIITQARQAGGWYVDLQLDCRVHRVNCSTSLTYTYCTVAGVLDEPYSQLTSLSGVAVQARPSTVFFYVAWRAGMVYIPS